MSLPAYLFLYDENGVLLPGACNVAGRIGSTEISSSQLYLPGNVSYSDSWYGEEE